MKCALLVLGIFNVTCCVALPQGVDKNKPYARVCLAVMDSATGEEEVFKATSKPGKGKKIVAHLDATAKGEAIVAAFSRKTGQLAYGWRPQFAEVTTGNEVLLPDASVNWDWVKEAGPIELYVLIFAPGSKEGAEVRELVRAMQSPKNETIARLQANKLRELIGRTTLDKARPEQMAKKDKSEVGGVFRMVVGFEWRDSARFVNFTAGKPAALIFP